MPPPRTVVGALLGWRRGGKADDNAAAADANGSSSLSDPEPELLVHWQGTSHAHDEWLPASRIPPQRSAGRVLLAQFRAQHGGAPCDLSDPLWRVPERALARRKAPRGPGWEVLGAWRGSLKPEERNTWEAEGEGPLASSSSSSAAAAAEAASAAVSNYLSFVIASIT